MKCRQDCTLLLPIDNLASQSAFFAERLLYSEKRKRRLAGRRQCMPGIVFSPAQPISPAAVFGDHGFNRLLRAVQRLQPGHLGKSGGAAHRMGD